MRQNRLTIPIAVQWGPDLGIIRPFVQAVPFVDVNLTSESALISAEGKKQWEDISGDVAKYQFGAGLGVGLDIWKFQFSLRYDWRFGQWTASSGGSITDLHRSGSQPCPYFPSSVFLQLVSLPKITQAQTFIAAIFDGCR